MTQRPKTTERTIPVWPIIAASTVLLFIPPFTDLWFLSILPLSIAIIVAIRSFEPSASERDERERLDLSEYQRHERVTVRNILDVLEPEKPLSGLKLTVAATGIARSAVPLSSPISKRPCIGYRIEIYLLKSSKSPLLSGKHLAFQDLAPCTIDDGTGEVAVRGTGLVQGATVEPYEYTWATIDNLPDIGAKIADFAKTRNLPKTTWKFIRIFEETIGQAATVFVYGVAERDKKSPVIAGLDIEERSDSLLVTDIVDSDRIARKAILQKHSFQRKARGATAALVLTAVSFMMGAGIVTTGKPIPSLNFAKRGSLSLINAGTIHATVGNFENGTDDAGDWELEPSAKAITLQWDEKDIWVSPDTDITLSSVSGDSVSLRSGLSPEISWTGKNWILTVDGKTPKLPPKQKGRIYVQNDSGKQVEISFGMQGSFIPKTLSWTFKPGDGMSSGWGSYCIAKEYGGDIIIETGDEIKLSVGGRTVTRLWPGYSPDIEWVGNEAWKIPIKRETLAEKKGDFAVRNLTNAVYEVFLTNERGDAASNSSWDIPAFYAKDDPTGVTLLQESEPITVEPGTSFMLVKRAVTELWKGKLKDCPYGSFNPRKAEWKIIVKE